MDWSKCAAVERDPERMGGKWCFKGLRLSAASLFEHIEADYTIDEYLDWFPEITREQVNEVLAFARASLEQTPTAA